MKYKILCGLVSSLLGMSSVNAMTALDDQALSEVDGQALLNLTKEAGTNNIEFFKLGMNAELSLNANIKSLQLGCGGDKGAGACDIDISELSFGCITGAKGVCITQETAIAGQPKGVDYDNSIENQKALKDFVLTNPFYQFAIQNGGQASTRQVVGIRVGADKAEGPMSIGSMNSFSGFLTGKTNLNIAAETNIAVTCDGNKSNCSSSDASKFSNNFTIDKLIGADENYYKANGFLGVKDDEILNLGIVTVRYKDLTIDTKSASSQANVAATGSRIKQVKIANLGLGTTVDGVVEGLKVNQICATPLVGNGCDAITGPDMANLLMPVLKTGIQNYMKEETLKGLGLVIPEKGALETAANYGKRLTALLNQYQLPYNLSNVHQLDVNSDKFGIALTALKEGIKFPGYDEAVPQGWSMYLQDAFTLNINETLTTLMSNIVQNGNAAAGNITMLAPAYRNCFGNLKFC